jgi:predicted nucleotide-binding protein
MNLEQAKEILTKAGRAITSEERLTNDTGYQLRIDCGAVVNIYDKGTYNVQGKEAALIKEALEAGITGVTKVGGKAREKLRLTNECLWYMGIIRK